MAFDRDATTPDWSDDYIGEHAYLVERGVRAMAIIGHIEADDRLMLQAASRLEIASTSTDVVPFVIPRSDGFADCGFAAVQWVVELYEWLLQSSDVPLEHMHRIRGLLLGYGAEAIRTYDERSSGRRFTSLASRASKSPIARWIVDRALELGEDDGMPKVDAHRIKEFKLDDKFQKTFDSWAVEVEKQGNGTLVITHEEVTHQGTAVLIFWRIAPKPYVAGRRRDR